MAILKIKIILIILINIEPLTLEYFLLIKIPLFIENIFYRKILHLLSIFSLGYFSYLWKTFSLKNNPSFMSILLSEIYENFLEKFYLFIEKIFFRYFSPFIDKIFSIYSNDFWRIFLFRKLSKANSLENVKVTFYCKS